MYLTIFWLKPELSCSFRAAFLVLSYLDARTNFNLLAALTVILCCLTIKKKTLAFPANIFAMCCYFLAQLIGRQHFLNNFLQQSRTFSVLLQNWWQHSTYELNTNQCQIFFKLRQYQISHADLMCRSTSSAIFTFNNNKTKTIRIIRCHKSQFS